MRELYRESHLHYQVRSCKGKCFAQERGKSGCWLLTLGVGFGQNGGVPGIGMQALLGDSLSRNDRKLKGQND
jgi:hypothetical protein